MATEYAPQYYLQKETKKILEEDKGVTNNSESLRDRVKTNLESFRKKFNESFPISENEEETIKRKNEINNIKTKYFCKDYFLYITENEINTNVQDMCFFVNNGRTIDNFLAKDFTEKKNYRTTEILDFTSIAIGFEGYKEAKKYEFDITKKPKESIFDKKVNRPINNFLGQIQENINLSDISYKLIALNTQKQNTNSFIDLVYEEIINSKKLSRTLIIKVETILDLPVQHWWQKSIIASALSLSIIIEWDKNKLKLLKRLAENEYSYLISHRAILGLTIGLIKSYENKNNFEFSLNLLKPLQNIVGFNFGIYECSTYLIKKWNHIVIFNEELKLNSELSLKKEYQFFEPIHKNNSYINKIALNYVDNLFDKIRLNYNSLSNTQQLLLINKLNSNPDEDYFDWEKRLITDNELYQYRNLEISFNNVLREFAFIIKSKGIYKKALLEINSFSKIDPSIFLSLFQKFPSHSYINFFPYNEIEKTLKFNDYKAFFDLGIILENTNRHEEALDAFEKAIRVNPNSNDIWLHYLSVTSKSKKSNNNLEYLKSLRTDFAFDIDYNVYNDVDINEVLNSSASELDVNSDFWFCSGKDLIQKQRIEEAIDCFHKVIEISPSHIDALHYLAYIYDSAKQYKKAIEYYNKIISINSNNHIPWYSIGLIHIEQKQYKQAIPLLEKSVEIEPLFVEGWNNLAISYNETFDYEKALRAYNKTIEINPDFITGWKNLAAISLNLKDYDMVLKYSKKVLEFDSNNLVSTYNTGYAYQMKMNLSKAIEYYNMTLQINPYFTSALLNLAFIYGEIKDYEKSIEYNLKVIKIDSQSFQAWYNLGINYLQNDQPKEALDAMQQSLILKPSSETVKLMIEKIKLF